MIVVEIPLEDVLIDVENELDLGTVSEVEASLHLTSFYCDLNWGTHLSPEFLNFTNLIIKD